MATVLEEDPALDASKLLLALRAVRKGDFSVRLPENWTGLSGKVADTFNEVVEMNERLALELARVSIAVGHHGKIEERATLGPVEGSWADTVTAGETLGRKLVQATAQAAPVIGRGGEGQPS